MAFSGKVDQYDCRNYLFLKEEFSDVVIRIQTDGSVCRYPCHKVILSVASEVFAAMFNSKLMEGETGQVTIKDIKPEIMLMLLTYIYSGSVDFDYWMIAVDVLRAAHKYQIESLIKCCEIYLSENLTLKNVCFNLDIAVLYDLGDLKSKCIEICRPGAFVILKSRPFKYLSACAVKEILNTENLTVATEMDVFNALWEWATMECCRKEMELTEENIYAEFYIFVKYVHFESMSVEELDSLPKTSFKKLCSEKKKDLPDEQKTGDKSATSDIAESDPNAFYIKDGLESYSVFKFFSFGKSSDRTFDEGTVSLMRFSMEADVYLTDFVLIALYDADATIYIQSFRMFCKDKTLIDWSRKDNKTLELHDNGCRSASVRDDTKFQEFVFNVFGFVLLEAGVEYTMELEAEDCKSCPIKWPSNSLYHMKAYRQNDVKLIVHSETSYGISELVFQRAT